jgi:predicted transcriptional regulator
LITLEKRFLKPNKSSRVLALLENLKSSPELSQAELAQKCALSGAMVNKYLKELRDTKVLSIEPVNGKSYNYRLTEQGEQLRQRFLLEYSTELVQLYTALKAVIRNKIEQLQQQGHCRLVLFGASETCEIVLAAMRGLPQVRVLAVVDNDVQKQGQHFHGHIISPPMVLEQFSFDSVLITTFARQQEIVAQLQPVANKHHFNIARL